VGCGVKCLIFGGGVSVELGSKGVLEEGEKYISGKTNVNRRYLLELGSGFLKERCDEQI